MAEAFGVAAGVFGVVSLSMQLAESVQKVKGFYKNIKNAPPKLADLLDEIGEMSDLIKELEDEHQSSGVVGSPLMKKCIESSLKAVEYFATFSAELDTRVKKRKFSGSIRFALSQEEIERMLNRVERAKSLLTLAYMQYQTALQQQQSELTLRTLQGLAMSQDTLLQLMKPDPTVQEPPTSKHITVPDHRRISTSCKRLFRARTPLWLSNTVWQLALNRSIVGWEFTMHTYGVVSTYAPIMNACRSNDVAEMQRLFDARVASPFDQDETGWSLWTLCLVHTDIDAIRLLRAYGVKLNSTTESSYAIFWEQALSIGHTNDYIRKALQFLHSIYDEDDAKTVRLEHEKSAMLLALCQPETATFLQFWQTIYFCGWDLGSPPTIPGPFADLLARYDDAEIDGISQLQLLAKSFGTIFFAPMDHDQSRSGNARNDIEKLIIAAISMGLPLHTGSNGITPFQLVLESFTRDCPYKADIAPFRPLNKVLLAWLNILQRADVSLLEYGKEEERLCKVHRDAQVSPGVFLIGVSLPRFERPALELEFRYGSAPSEWTVALLHSAEEYSGDFWQLVEAQAEEASFEPYVPPGGWIDV